MAYSSPPARPAPTILVVEDEPIIRQSLVEALTDAGFVAIEAEDAHIALRVLEAEPNLALVISDINMPGDLNGIDLARAIRSRFAHVKVMLTSGRPLGERSGIPTGTLFLQKPYTLANVVALVLAELSEGRR